MKRVLFLCTGNSCRSQMAEVILNNIGKGEFQGFSAGAKPTGYVHPLALRALREHNFPTDGLRSKLWEEFKGQPMDTIITVCDRARESCPTWPGDPEQIHWSIQDPAEAQGTDEEKMTMFNKVFAEIQQRIRLYLSVHQTKASKLGGRSF